MIDELLVTIDKFTLYIVNDYYCHDCIRVIV